MKDKITFSFGKNWEKFIKNNFTQERVEISKNHILKFLKLSNLQGKYFLDVGCGSGLSSLAAFESGAEKLVSFDVDPYSVKTTKKLREIKGNPSNWIVLEGSVLDKNFLSRIEKADIVYSWGVLHHTGAMWQAIENASMLMKGDGLFYVALYTTTPQSDYWIKIKKEYNRASALKKKLMECQYILKYTIIPNLHDVRRIFKNIFQYKKSRGMSYYTDVKDWLGGYPYEDASVEEVKNFCENKLNLKLINITTGEANTEYLFKKK